MLVLVQKALADGTMAGVIAARSGTRLLTTSRSAEGAASWSDLSTGETATPGEWLRKLLVRRPGRNAVFIAAGGVSDLGDTLKSLQSVDSSFSTDKAVLLLDGSSGAASKESLLMLGLGADPGLRVWWLAREDARGQAVDEKARSQFLDGFLQILGSMDDARARRAGFFDASSDEVIPVDADATGSRTARPGPFALPGLEFRGRPLVDYPPLIRALALGVLRSQLFRAGRDIEDRLLRQLPATLIGRLRERDIPYGGGEGAQQAARISNRLTGIPDVVRDWTCRLLRGPARQAGPLFFRQAEREVRDYYGALNRELNQLASQTRLHGASAAAQAKSEIRHQVEQCEDLGRLALLLRVFFPAFEQVAQATDTIQKTACLPAHSPSWLDARTRTIGEAEAMFRGRSEGLPTVSDVVWRSLGALSLLALAAWGWYQGWPARWSWISAGISVVGSAAWLLTAGIRARRITRDVQERLNEGLQAVRAAYVEKLEWAIRSAHRIAEVETYAYARSAGRRLRRSFDEFVGDWRLVEAESLHADDQLEAASQVWSNDELDDVREQLAKTSDLLRRRVLDETGTVEIAEEVGQLVRGLSKQAQQMASRRPIPVAAVRDALQELAKSRTRPSLLARLDDRVVQNRLHRVFVIPDGYPEELDGALVAESGAAGVPAVAVRTAVAGPGVFLVCRGLDEADYQQSFAVTQFGT